METLDFGFTYSENDQMFRLIKNEWPQLNSKTNIHLEPNEQVPIVGDIFVPTRYIQAYTNFKKGFKNYVKRILGSVIDAHSLIYQGMEEYYHPVNSNTTILNMTPFFIESFGRRHVLVCVYLNTTDTLYIKKEL